MIDPDVQIKLDALRWSYGVERDYRNATSPPLAETPHGTCRYCGKTRQHYAGSKLDGHAGCMVGDGFKRQLAEAMRDPRLNYDLLAGALGVTSTTIRAWFRAARRAA